MRYWNPSSWMATAFVGISSTLSETNRIERMHHTAACGGGVFVWKCSSTRQQVRLLASSRKRPKDDDETLTKNSPEVTLTSNNDDTKTTTTNEFATAYHAPVMYKECIAALLECRRAVQRRRARRKTKDPEQHPSTHTTTADAAAAADNDESSELLPLIFIDATLGGGGHSAALLEQLEPGDVVFGCDVDPEALATASERLSRYLLAPDNEQRSQGDDADGAVVDHPIFVPIQSNFANLVPTLSNHPLLLQQQRINQNDSKETSSSSTSTTAAAATAAAGTVDGILMDLGVSSHQIDTAQRGFAFLQEGPLDMRLNGGGHDDGGGGLTAADLINELDRAELQRLLQRYGDEPRSKAIATALVQRRPLQTTRDLSDAVASVVPAFSKRSRRRGRTATLARVFQSLRIAVNQEEAVLRTALEDMAPTLLRAPGGRLVVLSYHSLEDGATKRVMRHGTVDRQGHSDERDLYGNYIGTPRPFKTVGKPQKASPKEVEQNSRARSATLRVAERQET